MQEQIIRDTWHNDVELAKFVNHVQGVVVFKFSRMLNRPYIIAHQSGNIKKLIIPTYWNEFDADKIANETWENFQGFDVAFNRDGYAKRGSWRPSAKSIERLSKLEEQ